MVRKRFLVGLLIALGVSTVLYWVGQNNVSKEQIASPKEILSNTEAELVSKPSVVKPVTSKFDLYSETPYSLPLVSIYEISKLSKPVKKAVDNLLEQSQGFYYLKQIDDKVFVVLQNPVFVSDTYIRHGLQVAEVNSDGKVVYHTAGYSGVDGEIFAPEELKTDSWEYDKEIEPYRPIKHIAYDEKGKVKFVEYWNYAQDESVKYEMRDNLGKTISILKEVVENDVNYRKEHIFYDNEGNTVVSISINFEGADITRFNYYNAKKPESSVVIISDYIDGLKSFEKIYNKDYTLVNILEANYENGERKEIKLFDSEKTELGCIRS